MVRKGKGEKEEMKDRAQKRENRKDVLYVMRLRKRAGIKDMKLGGEMKNEKWVSVRM